MVMLADTDAGSIITASQSGAQWGYAMLLPQLLLIPILYVVQEMTVRLGLVTGKGHGELIREHFGLGWAVISVVTLFVACTGALVTEFAGIAGVAEMLHIPLWVSVPVVTGLLVLIGLSGSYRRVERIGIAVGLLELFFFVTALMAKPDVGQMAQGVTNLPLGQGNFLFLLAANVGAVIMPWMVFYQQGAVIDKKLEPSNLKLTRWDTRIGAVLTQLIMMAVVIATAVGVHNSGGNAELNSIQDVAHALEPAIGNLGVTFFGLGMVGAGFLAALVVSLAGAWGIGEAFRMKRSLDLPFRQAKGFYSLYTVAHVGGAVIVLLGIPLVNLIMDVEIMNALLLPVVLGFLLALEQVALPREYRMQGWRKYLAWALCGLVMLFGLFMGGQTLMELLG
jgi:Mn2+/Fe2+ NRAMP family transporter